MATVIMTTTSLPQILLLGQVLKPQLHFCPPNKLNEVILQ